MRNLYVGISFILFLFLILTQNAFAQSAYVLPYPSFMPGSRWYIIQEVMDEVKKYWYFGSFSQFKYHLSQSDKYLVEAKILFEYRQYLLGYQSLQKSNQHFKTIELILKKAEQEKKQTSEKRQVLRMATLKHIETLNSFSSFLPETFDWEPEKESSKILQLRELLDTSIRSRKSVL